MTEGRGYVHFDLRSELPDWMLKAACRGSDTNLFFPGAGEANSVARAAKAICAACPVQPDCLTWAVDTCEPNGVWGGMSERERRAERKRRQEEAA